MAESSEFSGQLSVVLLSELLLNLAGNRHTGTIEISDARSSGLIWMRDGTLLDAHAGSLHGSAAFYKLCQLDIGHFTVRAVPVNRPQTIRDSLQTLFSRRDCCRADWSAVTGPVVSLDATVTVMQSAPFETKTAAQRKLLNMIRGPCKVADLIEDCDDVIGALITLTRWLDAGNLVLEPTTVYEPVRPSVAGPGTLEVVAGSRLPEQNRRQTVRVPQQAPPARLESGNRNSVSRGTMIVRVPGGAASVGAPASTVSAGAGATAHQPLVAVPEQGLAASSDAAPDSEGYEPLAPYAFLDRYQVVSRLGRGAMGSVYLARLNGEGGFSRLVAIKVLRSRLYRNQQAMGMLMNEARIAARMQHRNVVSVLDVGSHKGQPYLVMDYVRGCTLEHLMSRGAEHASFDRIVAIIVDCLAGLVAIHDLKDERGQQTRVVHNDVSLRNVLVGVDGVSRLTDFGVASIKTGAGTTGTHAFGTAPYLAPERLAGAPGDQRSDIYAVGVLLWVALTGAPWHDAALLRQIMYDSSSGEAKPPSRVGRRPPECLDAICLRALAADPNRRYQTAEVMLSELQRAAVANNLLGTASRVASWASEVLRLDGDLPPPSLSVPVQPVPTQREPLNQPVVLSATQRSAGESERPDPESPLRDPLGWQEAGRSGPRPGRVPTLILHASRGSRARAVAKWIAVAVALAALWLAIAGPDVFRRVGDPKERPAAPAR